MSGVDPSTGDMILSWILLGCKFCGGVALALASFLYVVQDSMLYIPDVGQGVPKRTSDNPPLYRNPGEWDIKGRDPNSKKESPGKIYPRIPYEEVMLDTPDGAKIHCWLMLQSKSEVVPTLIYFHGNAGNMGLRLENAAQMYYRVGANILMMDYRGYGMSIGKPTEKGLNIDADVVLKYALGHPRLKSSRLLTFGRSLGGAVSISLAQRHPTAVAGLILENTFLSIPKMVNHLMPLISPLKSLILRINWDNEKKIQELKQPIMLIAGEKDEIVPHSMMLRLYELVSKSTYKELYKIPEGMHNNCFEVAGKEYYKRMERFVRRFDAESASDVDIRPGISVDEIGSLTSAGVSSIGEASSISITEATNLRESSISKDSESIVNSLGNKKNN
jgi:fermentation-respiration switch protein FrsA (DUF1100 family)